MLRVPVKWLLIALLVLSNIGWFVVYRFTYLSMKHALEFSTDYEKQQSQELTACMDARTKLFNDLIACEVAARQK